MVSVEKVTCEFLVDDGDGRTLCSVSEADVPARNERRTGRCEIARGDAVIRCSKGSIGWTHVRCLGGKDGRPGLIDGKRRRVRVANGLHAWKLRGCSEEPALKGSGTFARVA